MANDDLVQTEDAEKVTELQPQLDCSAKAEALQLKLTSTVAVVSTYIQHFIASTQECAEETVKLRGEALAECEALKKQAAEACEEMKATARAECDALRKAAESDIEAQRESLAADRASFEAEREALEKEKRRMEGVQQFQGSKVKLEVGVEDENEVGDLGR